LSLSSFSEPGTSTPGASIESLELFRAVEKPQFENSDRATASFTSENRRSEHEG